MYTEPNVTHDASKQVTAMRHDWNVRFTGCLSTLHEQLKLNQKFLLQRVSEMGTLIQRGDIKKYKNGENTSTPSKIETGGGG